MGLTFNRAHGQADWSACSISEHRAAPALCLGCVPQFALFDRQMTTKEEILGKKGAAHRTQYQHYLFDSIGIPFRTMARVRQTFIYSTTDCVSYSGDALLPGAMALTISGIGKSVCVFPCSLNHIRGVATPEILLPALRRETNASPSSHQICLLAWISTVQRIRVWMEQHNLDCHWMMPPV